MIYLFDKVSPHTGEWIEISQSPLRQETSPGLAPYGRVD